MEKYKDLSWNIITLLSMIKHVENMILEMCDTMFAWVYWKPLVKKWMIWYEYLERPVVQCIHALNRDHDHDHYENMKMNTFPFKVL